MCRKITNNVVKKVFYFYVKMLCCDKIMTDRRKTATCHDEKVHIGFKSINITLNLRSVLSPYLKKDYHFLLRICKRLFHKVIHTFRMSFRISSNKFLFIHVYLSLKFLSPVEFLCYHFPCFSFSTGLTDKRNLINEKKGKPYRLVKSMRSVRGQQLFVWPDKKIIISSILNQNSLGVGQETTN